MLRHEIETELKGILSACPSALSSENAEFWVSGLLKEFGWMSARDFGVVVDRVANRHERGSRPTPKAFHDALSWAYGNGRIGKRNEGRPCDTCGGSGLVPCFFVAQMNGADGHLTDETGAQAGTKNCPACRKHQSQTEQLKDGIRQIDREEYERRTSDYRFADPIREARMLSPRRARYTLRLARQSERCRNPTPYLREWLSALEENAAQYVEPEPAAAPAGVMTINSKTQTVPAMDVTEALPDEPGMNG